MISISDNDQKVIEFLIRNYANRYTTREIGLKLKISPAGAYKSLKKLESANFVHAEKLGTGLFYDINYKNISAFYLACLVMANNEQNVDALNGRAKALIKYGTSILIVAGRLDIDNVISTAGKSFQEKVEVIDEENFADRISRKDKQFVESMRNATIVYGTEYVIKSIAKVAR